MEIPVKSSKWPRPSRSLILIIIGAALLAQLFVNLYPSSVNAELMLSEIRTGIVTQGDLIQDVRAPGTLQPEKLRWIAASAAGRIEQILIEPGAVVTPSTVIMRMYNPSLKRDFESASFALQVARANLNALEKRLENERLIQEANLALIQAELETTEFRVEANASLADENIVSALDVKKAYLKLEQLKTRFSIEQRRLSHLDELHKAELEAQKAIVEQARSQLKLQSSLVADLDVKAGLSGILQEIPVEQGQQVSSGSILARVAQEDSLKAELRVQESQAKFILPGQQVVLTAGGQTMTASISRIEPAVQNGVVIVDAAIEGPYFSGARPDLRVDAQIIINEIKNTLFIKRPVFTEDNQTKSMFAFNENGVTADQVSVQFGISSLDKIQIIEGVTAGQRLILSDVRQFGNTPSIKLTH